MARTDKHKTKYKESSIKDFKKSQTAETRKDIKDYTAEDKDGGMNPNSTKEKQQRVLRKTDKAYEDTGDILPKNSAKYYKVEGDHDPKYSAKERAKLQDEDEKTSKDEIKDKIENLTREQKERLVREYVRRKIKKVLAEKKNAKPDFLDVDKDGDKDEDFKKAVKDKEAKNEQTPAGDPSADTPEEEDEIEAPPEDETEEPEPETEEEEEEEENVAQISKKVDDKEEEEEKEDDDDTVDDVVSDERKEIKRYLNLALKLRKAQNSTKAVDIIKPILKLGIKHFDEASKNDFWVILEKYVKPKSLGGESDSDNSTDSLPTNSNLT